MTMNAPLTNCFQKFCGDIQSPKSKMRQCSLFATAFTASSRFMSNAPATFTMISTRATSMHNVWNESVYTSVLIPPLRV